MIPCIAIPVLNRPDLLKRCIDSIDFPVQRVLVIDNGKVFNGEDFASYKPADGLISHAQMHANLGVAGSWNFALQDALIDNNLPAVLICGSDIQWLPGQLKTFYETWMANHDASFLFAHWSFSTFMVTRRGFDTMGWFDENFYPAYLEDGDYWWRIGRYKKLGVDVKVVDVPVKPIHGEAPHWGSATLHSDPAIARVIKQGHERNWSYYTRKWGGQVAGNTERFDTPFNNPEVSVNYWLLSPERIRQPHWKSQG